jgi:hypothetical protein
VKTRELEVFFSLKFYQQMLKNGEESYRLPDSGYREKRSRYKLQVTGCMADNLEPETLNLKHGT